MSTEIFDINVVRNYMNYKAFINYFLNRFIPSPQEVVNSNFFPSFLAKRPPTGPKLRTMEGGARLEPPAIPQPGL
jgi:hypothetical protein